MMDILGTTGNDVLNGTVNDDVIDAQSGDDTVYGGSGNDVTYGWYGNDLITGEAGNDSLYGENNADTIYGGAGDDWIVGDGIGDVGRDRLIGGAGADTLQGGDDDDMYIFHFNSDGQDLVYDSQGSYDYLRIGGVTNISQLTITPASTYGGSANNLLIHKDGTPAEYIQIHNYYGTGPGGFGEGRIEHLDVNGSLFWLSDFIGIV